MKTALYKWILADENSKRCVNVYSRRYFFSPSPKVLSFIYNESEVIIMTVRMVKWPGCVKGGSSDASECNSPMPQGALSFVQPTNSFIYKKQNRFDRRSLEWIKPL